MTTTQQFGTGALALGLDAGGTQTRWALAAAGREAEPVAGQPEGSLAGQSALQGSAAPMSGLQLDSEAGRDALLATLQSIAAQAAAAQPGPVQAVKAVKAVVAGVTGFDAGQTPALLALMSRAFGLPLAALRAVNDIELACHAATQAAGPCYVVYAGTGSVAAFIDEAGQLQRVGGRGAIIDDAGGGHWIARRALRTVWRVEDESPGAWQQSPLARQLFARIGGSDWACTRQWVYGASRGAIGTLALAVAEAAQAGDPAALALLQQAGRELARLALALLRRHGPRPLVLAGRAFDLHPAVHDSLVAAVHTAFAATLPVQRLTLTAHEAAARWAAQLTPS